MKTQIYKELDKVFEDIDLPYQDMEGKKILITGANGLIGRMIIMGLCAMNKKYELNLCILALVRNEDKIRELLADEIENGYIKIIRGDVREEIKIHGKVDYIIHGASMTASNTFIENPVEVIMTNIIGTRSVMNLACEKKVSSAVFLSSMEAYGFIEKEDILTEDKMEYLNPLKVRSCYPESKRMAENLCVSYFAEYNVPVKIIRLAQTFGYGIDVADKRVFAEFASCVREKRDIVLLTDGASKRMYLDTIDAVTAILTVLLKGENGTAYNAANKETYCSVKEMAEFVAKNIAGGEISVLFNDNVDSAKKFSPPHRLFLDVSRLEGLGWSARAGLLEMYGRVLNEKSR